MKKTEQLLLNDLYSQALDALSTASDACIFDGEGDETVPLLVLEAAYRIACFFRAARGAGCQKEFAEQELRLKAFLKDIIKNMSGDGHTRLSETCSQLFAVARIQEAAAPLQQEVQDGIEMVTLDELKSQDQFKQALFDLFIVFDRFYCLSHPVDSPLKDLKSMLWQLRTGIVSSYTECRGLFALLREEFSTFARKMCIPSEKQYSLWYSFPGVTVEGFISSFHNALADMQKQRDPVAVLVQELPPRLRERLEKLPLKKRFSELIDKLSTYVYEVKNYCELLVTPVTVQESPAVYGKKVQKATSPFSLARAMYSDALSKLPALIQNSPELSPREKRELLLVTYLLLDDREKLKKYLPARKRTK